MENTIYLNTDAQVRVAFDPYRMRIIETYFKMRIPQTAKQIADLIDEPAGKVHYHIQKLKEIDLLELERTEYINGIRAKYYKLKYKNIYIDKELQKGRFFKEVRGQAWGTNFRINVEWFSEDIVKAHELTFAGEVYDPGYVLTSHNKIYMTTENRIEFQKRLRELVEFYSSPKESANTYTTLFGMARIE